MRTSLLLVGGGHAHLPVLAGFAERPLEGVSLTLVCDQEAAVYSGMVPGLVAGQYEPREVSIDLVALARRAKATFVHARVERVDAAGRGVMLEDGRELAYDLASLDVGSTVGGLDVPGVREHALATRPIDALVRRVPEAAAAAPKEARVVVVGGGAAGVELAFCLEARLRAAGGAPEVTLVHAAEELLGGLPRGLARRARRQAARRGIAIRDRARVRALEAGQVLLEGADPLPADLALWAAGPAAHAFLAASGLPCEPRGYVLVRDTLQVEGHDALFAAGDCATPSAHPDTPKAGVYAVREGPILAYNLRAALTGGELRRYTPQREFLALLNLGDGTALGSKWGFAVGGRWVLGLKDRIDRAFVERYQVA